VCLASFEQLSVHHRSTHGGAGFPQQKLGEDKEKKQSNRGEGVKLGNTESAEKNRAYTGRLKKTKENKHRQRLHREKAKEKKEPEKSNERRNSTPSPSSCS
jgi:hypothetical protein